MRSFRAESLSRFVKALLDGEAEAGRELLESFREQYPIVLTRSMRAARRWIRQQRRGTERAGLVASSSARRLKPHAIDIRVNIDPVHWFLSPAKDTRSSLYLEDAATEFQVQGLELDWTKLHGKRRFRQSSKQGGLAPIGPYDINTAWLRHKPSQKSLRPPYKPSNRLLTKSSLTGISMRSLALRPPPARFVARCFAIRTRGSIRLAQKP
jgi:hypothetical protein